MFQYANRCFQAKWQKYKANRAKRTASWIASQRMIDSSNERAQMWAKVGRRRSNTEADLELGDRPPQQPTHGQKQRQHNQHLIFFSYFFFKFKKIVF